MTDQSSTRPTSPLVNHVPEKVIRYLGSLALNAGGSLSYGQLDSYHYSARQERLSQLGLEPRDLEILTTVAACRLITSRQLQRLYFTNHSSPLSSARACSRTLKRLDRQKILSRRNRRIGGVHRGSASFVYSVGTNGVKLLDVEGQRLRSYTTDPSDYFSSHTLELSELYTRLHEMAHSKELRLLEVQTEPDCWRQLTTETKKLRPDMFVRTAKGDVEYSYFIEVDRGTIHMPSILLKLQLYAQYYASGVEQEKHGVFPQVLWIVPDAKREVALNTAIKASQSYPDGLFVVRTADCAVAYIREPDG